MKMIVGLGNPGREYEKHRHNVGFMVVDALSARYCIGVKRRAFGALVGNGAIEGESGVLSKPLTYMNCSGDAVAPLLAYYKLSSDDLIVIHDDLDIALGCYKIMCGAGHGGHNGIRSIIEALGTNDFIRMRIGIGRPPVGVDPTDYVLHGFDVAEEDVVKKMLEESVEIVALLISKGLSVAQQKYH